MRPYDIWTRHLHADRKEEFEALVQNSTIVLGRMKTILHEQLESTLVSEETEGDFDTPAWAYRQAYRNGERAGLRRALRLLAHIKGI